MRTIKIWVGGGAVGSGTTVALLLSTSLFSLDGQLGLIEMGISLICPAIIAVGVSRVTGLPIVMLLSIAYLTVVIPGFGALFGAPDLDVGVAGTLFGLGLVGGLIWSIPFACWSYFTSRTK